MTRPPYHPDTLAAFVPLDDDGDQWKPPPWPNECPRGFCFSVSYEVYSSWPAVNSQALKIGYQVSPKHMRAVLDGHFGTDDSGDRRFGRAEHCRVLEPARYRERFLIAEPCQAPIKTGQRAGSPCGCTSSHYDAAADAWYCGTHKPATAQTPTDYVSAADAERIERSVAEIFGHKVVRLLRQHGGREVSIVWERDGLPCKARLDKLIRGAACPDTVVDLKKCQPCKATDYALQRSIRDYGWDIQAAWYVDGVERLTGSRPLFAWIFVEDREPFDVRPVWASQAMLAVGKAKADRAWQTYLHCLQTGHWPGYCEDIEELNPTEGEMKRFGVTPDM